MSTVGGDTAMQRRRAWIAAVERSDAETYASIVTEDVVWFPPAGDPLRGRASFRRWIEPFMGAFRYRFELEPDTSNEGGGFAYETGAFRSTMTPSGGGVAEEHHGHYIVLWRLEPDGAWRIERYVDVAAPPGGGRG